MAVTDMFKDTINNFKDDIKSTSKSVGGAYDAAKSAGSSAINTAKPYAAKVLAKLNTAKNSAPVKLVKSFGSGLVDNMNTIPSLYAAGDDVGMTFASDADWATKVGGTAEALGNVAAGFLADRFSAGKKSAITKGGVALGNGLTDFRPATQLASWLQGGGDTPLMQMRKMLVQQDLKSAEISKPTVIVSKEPPKAEFPQESANQVADAFVDDIYGKTGSIGLSTPVQPQTEVKQDPQQDSLSAIRETLAQAQAERGKVVNPLQQQSNMELKDYSNNPFAAVMQLQQAVGQMAPYAASNKIARENAANLTTDAQKQAGLVELENTLKNSSITQEKGQLELAQSKRLNDAMVKLGTLTDEKERRALQDSILTMLGKEPKDDYVIQEVGGGTDANGVPQPKRAVVFDKRTGQVVSEVGGGANGAGQQAGAATQYKVGQKMQTKDGKVLTAVKDKDGNIQWDDGI